MADPVDFAVAFDEMAARIRRNGPEEFGGALLIVPPTGDPIAVLTVTPKADDSMFWAQCKSKLDVAAAERLEALQNPNPFGRR